MALLGGHIHPVATRRSKAVWSRPGSVEPLCDGSGGRWEIDMERARRRRASHSYVQPILVRNGELMEEHSRTCCERRRQLAIEFANAARLYSEAAVTLATSGLSEHGYAHFCKLTLKAQDRAEAAFASYEEHVDSHRCVGGHETGTSTGARGEKEEDPVF